MRLWRQPHLDRGRPYRRRLGPDLRRLREQGASAADAEPSAQAAEPSARRWASGDCAEAVGGHAPLQRSAGRPQQARGRQGLQASVERRRLLPRAQPAGAEEPPGDLALIALPEQPARSCPLSRFAVEGTPARYFAATASISTTRSGCAKAATTRKVEAGSAPFSASSRILREAATTSALVTKMLAFTRSSMPMPAAARMAMMLAQHCLACASKPLRMVPSGVAPTWPETCSQRALAGTSTAWL